MTDDEQAIREAVEIIWMQASRSGDTVTVLALMTEDVVFMVPGREPFGREAFEEAAANASQRRPTDRRDQRDRGDSGTSAIGLSPAIASI